MKNKAKKVLASIALSAAVAGTAGVMTGCSQGEPVDYSAGILDGLNAVTATLSREANYNVLTILDLDIEKTEVEIPVEPTPDTETGAVAVSAKRTSEVQATATETVATWTITAGAKNNQGVDVTLAVKGEGVDYQYVSNLETAMGQCYIVTDSADQADVEYELDASKVEPFLASLDTMIKNTENISTEKYTSSADVTTEINKDQMYTWLTNYYANSAETNAVENLHTLTGNKIKDQQSETADNSVYYVSSFSTKDEIWNMAISISVNNYTYAANFSITNNGYNKSKVIGFVKDYITNGTVEGDLKVTGVECLNPNSTMQLFNAIDALANQNENINQA